eukprot:TRINITY_DN7085_c0_g3_i8.p2 TRINITY_DN7085_c0_g3~~TRINITY_DN7085_c0_g3_i8.p2  ORF type:complete len:217 (+),score=69.66 TRINITY_DN7085_c0_g3_i8:1130-1780(+)
MQKNMERNKELVSSYMSKAEHIEENKKRRKQIYQIQTERAKEMLIERRLKHEQIYERQRNEDIKDMEEYRKLQDLKKVKAKFLAQKMQIESKQYWRELVEFNKSLQLENKARIDKLHELKRNLVWHKHKQLQDKNSKKNAEYEMKQCTLRTKAIYDLGRRERVYEYINGLRKADPNQEVQRQGIIKSLKSLNSRISFKGQPPLPLAMKDGEGLKKS